FVDLAHRQHDVSVRLRQSVRADIPMHIEVGDHAALDELRADEITRQLDPLFLGHLAGNGELDLARELPVLAQLGGLDRVPKLLPVAKSGLIELSDDDRAAIFGLLVEGAAILRTEQRDEALTLWRRRGRRAFDADAFSRDP